MPSNQAVLDLLPLDGSHPFETNTLLRHKAVFSHIVYQDIDKSLDEQNATALNGVQILIKKEEEEEGGEGTTRSHLHMSSKLVVVSNFFLSALLFL